MKSEKPFHGRPTAAELVAAVAGLLETQVKTNDRRAQAEVSAAAETLRIVERELLDKPAGDARDALAVLGYSNEAQVAAAIRNGDLDHRADDVTAYLRARVSHRLSIAHPGYQSE
jgi:hypothetical protein